jgi:tryptophan halogenase
MGDTFDEVMIVGGGDAGLLTGLAIQRLNPGVDISVVDDFGRDIPKVGKSTYWKIQDVLYNELGIDPERFLHEVKPVWKCSVYFRDWCDRQFHIPFDISKKLPDEGTPAAAEHYYHYYDELFDSPDHRTKDEAIVTEGVSPWHYNAEELKYEKYQAIAFHLNNERFNSFLRDLCRERGISLVDDAITGVDTDGSHISHVRSEDREYEADLYVDASGFNRVLKQAVGGEFTEFAFRLDTAWNARVDRPLSEVVPATVVESGENGWFWQIDTYDNRDFGYVFASDFVSDEAARAAFLEYCDGDISADDVTKYEFTSGFYDPAWVENCLAIGNAGGFVEPLQSTGLTTNALAAVTLSKLLSAHGRVDDDGLRSEYNAWVRRTWESIRDFIAVHYKFADGDSEFWQAMRSLEVSPRVTHLVEEFDRTGFDTHVTAPTETAEDIEDLEVFGADGFYVLMRHLGVASEFYETNPPDVSEAVKQEQEEFYSSVWTDVADHLTTEEVYSLHE